MKLAIFSGKDNEGWDKFRNEVIYPILDYDFCKMAFEGEGKEVRAEKSYDVGGLKEPFEADY